MGTEVDADGVNEREGKEVREGEKEVALREKRNIMVLIEESEDLGGVEPEEGEREGDREEKERGTEERE